MKYLTILAILFLSVCKPAYANSFLVSFGPSLDGSIGIQKVFQLGYEFQWGSPSLELKAGSWNEPNGFAFTGGATMGIHLVSHDGFAMRVGFGPAAISQTDDRLSSIFEFNIETKIGLELKNYQTGFEFDHWSNAGLFPGSNLGRDVISIYIGIPL